MEFSVYLLFPSRSAPRGVTAFPGFWCYRVGASIQTLSSSVLPRQAGSKQYEIMSLSDFSAGKCWSCYWVFFVCFFFCFCFLVCICFIPHTGKMFIVIRFVLLFVLPTKKKKKWTLAPVVTDPSCRRRGRERERRGETRETTTTQECATISSKLLTTNLFFF